MLLGKHFGVPLHPRDGITKERMKLLAAAWQPGVVVVVSLPEIVRNELKEFDGLAFHFRETRRSSSARVMRLAVPVR